MTIYGIIKKEYKLDKKRRILSLVEKIVKISNKVYKEGLLSLDEVYTTLQPELLSKGADLLMEGYSPDELRDEVIRYIYSKPYDEIDLLETYIIQEGLILLLENYWGDTLHHKLLCLSAADYINWEREIQLPI